MNPFIPLLAATAVLCLLFGAVFFFSRRINNYGVVDIAWSYSFGLVALVYAFSLDGWWPRRVVMSVLVLIWSLRLGTHLLRRVARDHPKEDARYLKLRDEWGTAFTKKMAGFFQLQAISVVALALPFLLSAADPASAFHPMEVIALLLWFIGVVGEALADAQLAAFKRMSRDPSAVCAVGFWGYSRHPNYFFEWLIWVAYGLGALAAPWGAIGLFSPLCILWLLLRVTGIPMTEKQSLRSKGEAYRRYQSSTNAFLPWFPKRVAETPAKTDRPINHDDFASK